ncbi:MAG TPA: DUF5666 domain-containing protein, partial [Anaerolineales bacterium]|nr:DUF5666 domain-containing protein [Anaerolineales bacterium]
MEEETIFQQNLERLEAGESLETVLAGLSEEQAARLRLVRRIRTVSQFARDPKIVASQHQHVMHLWDRQKKNSPIKLLPSFLKWAVPVGLLLLVCMAFTLITGGLTWLGARQGGVAETTPGGEIVKAPVETSEPAPTSSSNTLTPFETPVAGQLPNEATPTYEPFPPLVVPEKTPPTASAPHVAVLQSIHGLVQIQQPDNSWQSVEAAEIQAGQTFRTWVSSSATLYFYDGSMVTLGANTRLTLEALNAPKDGPREIRLFQPYGETHHTVAPGAPDSYLVRTPSATGAAKGTTFQVIVADDKSSAFRVEEGIVDVKGKKNTVQLYAGQMTSVAQNDDPAEPVFWITGQGEVSQTGEVWVIGGLSFQTHAGTVIIGAPQVGDLVSIRGRLFPDGTRLADRINLLAPSYSDRFRLTGVVESIGQTWMVSGQEIQVDETTQIGSGITTGSRVLVTGVIREGGVLFAVQITLLDEETRFEFTGLVEQIEGDIWTIAGVAIATDENTEIIGEPGVGDLVKVEGRILPDGAWLADEIKKVSEVNHFEFIGTVQSIDPWVVSGISFEVDDFTQISPGIEVGSLVHVVGIILEDGTWLATSIELLDDANTLVFIGIVDSTDPWVVNGLSLTTDENTIFIGEIVEGSLVWVEVLIQPDGAWLVLRMELIETGPVAGCIEFADVVVALSQDEITLATGLVIPRAIAEIEGDLQVGSQVLVKLCFGPDNVIVFALILVVGDPLPPRPTPTPPPGGGKVTICHIPPGNPGNAHTITVD